LRKSSLFFVALTTRQIRIPPSTKELGNCRFVRNAGHADRRKFAALIAEGFVKDYGFALSSAHRTDAGIATSDTKTGTLALIRKSTTIMVPQESSGSGRSPQWRGLLLSQQ
jgi:hypothetical protein